MPSNRAPQSFLPPAGRTSVTVVHDSTKSYGLRLARRCRSSHNDGYGTSNGSNSNSNTNGKSCEDTIVIDMIANHHSNGMLKGAPLNEGDILRTINNRRAANFLGCRNYSTIRSGSFRDGQSVTFVAERPSELETEIHGGCESEDDDDEIESGSAIIRAFGRRSVDTNNDGRAMSVGVEFHRVIIGEEEDSETDSDIDSSSSSVSSSPPSTKSSSSSFLQIDRIDPNGLFAHSVLNQGDIVLAINGYSICADENTTVGEANELMGVHASSEQDPGVSAYETVDILALNPRKLLELKKQSAENSVWGAIRVQRRKWVKQQAKRAGVAIGGGAMIGVGAVVHPFGTLLMASGVSVLGTEFETPNRIVRSARDSLEKWAMDNNEQIILDLVSNEDNTLDSSSEWSVEEPTSASEATTSTISGREDTAIGANYYCDEKIKKSTPLSSPISPLPTMTNRMKGLGRRYVLPFLDRMAGDRRNPRRIIESSSSFDIGVNYTNESRNNAILQESQEQGQQRQQQQQQQQLQGRDDDCGHNIGSNSSLEQNLPPCSSESQRVT